MSVRNLGASNVSPSINVGNGKPNTGLYVKCKKTLYSALQALRSPFSSSKKTMTLQKARTAGRFIQKEIRASLDPTSAFREARDMKEWISKTPEALETLNHELDDKLKDQKNQEIKQFAILQSLGVTNSENTDIDLEKSGRKFITLNQTISSSRRSIKSLQAKIGKLSKTDDLTELKQQLSEQTDQLNQALDSKASLKTALKAYEQSKFNQLDIKENLELVENMKTMNPTQKQFLINDRRLDVVGNVSQTVAKVALAASIIPGAAVVCLPLAAGAGTVALVSKGFKVFNNMCRAIYNKRIASQSKVEKQGVESQMTQLDDAISKEEESLQTLANFIAQVTDKLDGMCDTMVSSDGLTTPDQKTDQATQDSFISRLNLLTRIIHKMRESADFCPKIQLFKKLVA